jgi:hypothetical protein
MKVSLLNSYYDGTVSNMGDRVPTLLSINGYLNIPEISGYSFD